MNFGVYEPHFSVTESLKGTAGQEIVIRTINQDSACGFKFETGSDYLVFAYRDPKSQSWWTSLCTRTHKSVNDDADLQWIRGLAKAPTGGEIFGTVRSFSPGDKGVGVSSPLSNIRVTVTGPISKAIITDSSGQFRTTALPPGAYTVSAVAPTGYPAFSNEKVSVHDRGCAVVDFSTDIGWSRIRGHVYFANGAPARGLVLTAENIDAKSWEQLAESTKNGSFDLSPLGPGRYVLGINVTGPIDALYYRKAFYPGVTDRSEAKLVRVGRAQVVDKLRFVLPTDLPAPSIPLRVTLHARDGKPVPNATILPQDDMWNSLTLLDGEQFKKTNSEGKATLFLRKGAYYNISAYVNRPDHKQECAEPVGVLAKEGLKPITLVVSHPVGNCFQFKKPRR